MIKNIQTLNASQRGVLMLGTAIGDRGGIGSVVATLRDNGLFERNQVEYIATHRDGSAAQKIAIVVTAWFRCMARMILGRVLCVHVHLASRASFWRKVLFVGPAYLLQIPVILHLHGAEFQIFYNNECSAVGRWCIRMVFRRASKVVALSSSWAKWLRETLVLTNVDVIYNPIAVPQESARPRDPAAVLFLGRLGERKGTFVLLDAASRVAKAGGVIKLLLGGDGDIDTFRKYASELGILDHVEFLGWVSGERKLQLLYTAGVYCLPSFNEGLPISLLEAMAIGMPVVTTPVGGIPELVTDGVDGYLVPTGDAAALAEKLGNLIRNPAVAKRMGKLGRQKIQDKFSVNVIIPKVELLYESYL